MLVGNAFPPRRPGVAFGKLAGIGKGICPKGAGTRLSVPGMKLGYLKILVAEDDENDRFLLERAIAKTGAKHEVHMVTNGQEAINYLQAEGEYRDRTRHPFPNFLILDVKMPIRSGFEVVQWLRGHEECSVIPTTLFTSSARPEDIKKGYVLGANAFFTKPHNLEDLVKLLNVMFEFWYHAQVPDLPPQEACE